MDSQNMFFIFNSVKPPTCLLDPILTKLLKDIVPLISTSILEQIIRLMGFK